MKVIVNVCIEKEGKILMVQEGVGKVRGLWNFPAGHLDEGESIFEGAIREAKEETGYDVKLTGILDVQNCLYNDGHIIHIVFAGEIIGGQVVFDAEEIMSVNFIDIKKLQRMTDKELRGADSRKITIDKLLKKKIFPLELITNLNYLNVNVEK